MATNNSNAPQGYGEGYERPLRNISDFDLLNPKVSLEDMNLVQLCDYRNELVARRYSLFNDDSEKLQQAITPYADMYKKKM